MDIYVTYCTKQDKNHSLYSSTFPYIYIGVYLPKCQREDREFEVVDYNFILNTIQVYETGPHFLVPHLLQLLLDIFWCYINMVVAYLHVCFAQCGWPILREQLIDVLDDDSSSAGFHPISSFQLHITVPSLSAAGGRYGLNLWVHI